MNSKKEIVQALENSSILLKGVSETNKNETKKHKKVYPLLSGTLGASLLGNMLAGRGIVRAFYGNKKNLIPSHPLTNFEVQKYYQNEPRFNGVYARDKLTKAIKDGTYVINLDEYADVGTHWIALYVKNTEIIFF